MSLFEFSHDIQLIDVFISSFSILFSSFPVTLT
jgi:hypothetical protein